MNKRDELIALYVSELKSKCGVTADVDLLTKVTIGCGPSIQNKDSSAAARGRESELETVKNNYLIGKLGMKDGANLDAGIKEVCEQMGASNKNKYRAMFYYLLCVKFDKQNAYQFLFINYKFKPQTLKSLEAFLINCFKIVISRFVSRTFYCLYLFVVVY